MTFFTHFSWKLIEKLEIYCGLWPYQSPAKNYFIRFIFILLLLSSLVPALVRLYEEWGINLEIVTQNISGTQLSVAIVTKMAVAGFYSKKRQKLDEKVNDQFKAITNSYEAYVLDKSADNSMKFCIKYCVMHAVIFVGFFCLPLGRMVYEYLMNGKEFEKMFPYYVDYNFVIDENKYYVHILIQILIVAFSYCIMNCACDFPFIMNVRHVCTIFKIVNIRLQEASGLLQQYEWDMLDFTTADSEACELITQAIHLHNETFEMVSLIEDIYKYSLFVVILESIFIFNGGIYVVLLSLHQPLNLARYWIFFIGLIIHFYIQFLHGQIIMDASSSVFDACYKVKWYLASFRTRRLLNIMMLRSSTPAIITGGGLFIISMETCGKFIKAGFSYLSIFTQRMNQ